MAVTFKGPVGLRGRVPRIVIVDALIVAVLVAAGAWWGARYVATFVESGRQPHYFQSYFEPAVMLACGRGFIVAEERPRIVDDFLEQRVDTVACGDLPSELTAADPSTVYQYAWFYLMTMVGLAWKVVGVSWSGLAPLFGMLFGVVIALAYGLFRVVVPPAVAVLPSVALMASSLHLQSLPHLRDYAKAPFVLALILLLVWMVARPLRTPWVLGLAAVYGAVMGIGYGFRTDLLANIPPFVITTIFFLPGGLAANLKMKLAAIALAGVTFAGASWPAASFVATRGGCQWHVVLLGLDDTFNDNLGMTPSYYAWTSAFSDEYVHTAVNSYQHRVSGGGPVPYCSAEYDEASGAYLREIYSRFPADLLTRAYASVLQVIDLPFYWWHAFEVPRRTTLGALLTHVTGLAGLAVVGALLAIGTHSVRLGLFALALVLYFGGYPSLQFAARHMFHLEFIGWWAMTFLAWHAALWFIDGRRAWPGSDAQWKALGARAATFALIVAAVVLLPFPVVRAYQNREAATLVRSLLDRPRVEVPLVRHPDGRTLTVGQEGLAGEAGDATETAYLDVHLDPDVCSSGASLGLLYDPAAALYDFSRPVRVNPPGPVPSRILVPVYRRFQGLTLDGAPTGCVTRVERLASVRGLPLLPVLTLPADWTGQATHQSLGPLRWAVPFRLFGWVRG